MKNKEYISVVADYMPDGAIRPVSITFADGSSFAVAGLISVIHMSATKQNGKETRYCVKLGGREHNLYFEDAGPNKSPGWFVCDYCRPDG